MQINQWLLRIASGIYGLFALASMPMAFLFVSALPGALVSGELWERPVRFLVALVVSMGPFVSGTVLCYAFWARPTWGYPLALACNGLALIASCACIFPIGRFDADWIQQRWYCLLGAGAAALLLSITLLLRKDGKKKVSGTVLRRDERD